MGQLRSIRLPGGGLLAYSEPAWVKRILPSDSWKKKVIRFLSWLRILDLVGFRFDGRTSLDGHSFDLFELTRQLPGAAKNATLAAIFVNSRRRSPRVYAWLQSGGEDFFLKIGTASDEAAFRNEIEVTAQLSVPPGFRVMRPIELLNVDGLFLLLSQGISPAILDTMTRMEPRQVFARLAAQSATPTGPFRGPVHSDLASNNVFAYGDEILLVDWEFAALSGPDYCDLVGLAAEIAAEQTNTGGNVEATCAYLRQETGYNLEDDAIIECLEFLATRGNRRAQHILAGVASRGTTTDGSSICI